jgi:hypothetical protein
VGGGGEERKWEGSSLVHDSGAYTGLHCINSKQANNEEEKSNALVLRSIFTIDNLLLSVDTIEWGRQSGGGAAKKEHELGKVHYGAGRGDWSKGDGMCDWRG